MRHHRVGLARALADDEMVGVQATAFLDAVVAHASAGTPLPLRTTTREAAIVHHALQLSRSPAAVRSEDIDSLRAAGLDDAEILDVNQVTAYYAYANRVASGLGLEVEHYKPVV